MLKKIFPALILGIGILVSSCKKKLDDFTSPSLAEYYPLQLGKYITYQLDSTVFLAFGVRDTIIKYQVQDRVDAQITDNNGKPAYRIIRFIRKNANQAWSPAGSTFMVVPSDNSVEFIEDNLKYIKLKRPVTEGFTWKGNAYIDASSINSEVRYLDDWDYTYDSLNIPLQLGNVVIDSTITVSQRDEFLGQDPKLPGTQYAEKNYGVEKYAKGIGLVFKEFIHWEYQGAHPPVDATYTGYGVKLSIIDHN
ncbi:MAG: hypothetical protein ABIO55_04230 [Ginsengibacter sp.]